MKKWQKEDLKLLKKPLIQQNELSLSNLAWEDAKGLCMTQISLTLNIS